MKKTLTIIASIMMLVQTSVAQTGSIATDFTITDLSGVTHNLNTILGQGKVVVLDCSATWCSPCWGFHQAEFLKDINDTYGPNGTDQVRVIFYEADANTTLADLQGTTGGTQGDWLTGADYPIVNENPISLSGAKYWPLGFPTINVINPADGKIEADLYDSWNPSDLPGSLVTMIDIIDNFFPTAETEELVISKTNIFPNPSKGDVTIKLNASTTKDVVIEVSNLIGQVVFTSTEELVNGSNEFTLDLTDLANGQYIVKLTSGSDTITNSIQVKK